MKRSTRSSAKTDQNYLKDLPMKPKRRKKSSKVENIEEEPNSSKNDTPSDPPKPTLEFDENSNEVEPTTETVSQSSHQTEILKYLSQIFGWKYLNRLQLDWNIDIFDFKEDDPEEPDFFRLDIAKTLFLSSSHQHTKGMALFEDMLSDDIFPYPDIFQDIFFKILVLKTTEEEEIPEIQLLFCNLLNNFPPWRLRKYYYNFITESIDVPKYVPNKRSDNITIVDFIITHIESTMNDNQLYEKELSAGELKQDVHNSSELLSFTDWEKKQETRNFDLLTRSVKLERLFSCLDLLVRMFEMDLVNWIRKFQRNVKMNLFNSEIQPLVVKAFKINEYKLSTNMVKTVLKIFSDLVAFDYPDDCKDIVSRLISVLSTVVNLSENYEDTDSGTVNFPHIGSATEDFVKDIFKACDYNNINIYFCSLKHLRTPYIKYLFVEQVITKVFNRKIELKSPEDILNHVISKKPLWFEFDVKGQKIEIEKSTTESERFPLVSKIKVEKNVEFYRDDFMEMLLISLENFCDAFEVKRCCFLFSESRQKKVLEELRDKDKADFIAIPMTSYYKYGRDYLKSYAILFNQIDYLQKKCQVDLQKWKQFLQENI